MEKHSGKILARNRRARYQYFIEETFEAGIVLQGTEVKSIRLGKANLRDSFARVDNEELFLYDLHISPYDYGSSFNHEPRRIRKLLMHRREINRLAGYVQEKGYTLVPLSLYLKNGRVKVELALAKGKKAYDKRQSIAERDAQREVERGLKDKFLSR
ncbi:MAG: SsrA-binding protein SmpB [Dethiobacteria bacterium]|jgi:SsrA-binding protein